MAGRIRRSYGLTDKGSAALRAEAQRMAEAARLVTGKAVAARHRQAWPEGEDRMSTLERHCQLLLRAYPAAYREVRGEEIIGTLLEATPPGRSWPLPRDIRVPDIRRAPGPRCAQPQLTTGANLRIALLAGVAAYLAYLPPVS